MIWLGIFLCVVLSVGSLPPRPREGTETGDIIRYGISVYNTAEYIEQDGYVVETHDVTTEDGYILGVFRIPYARHKTEAAGDRPVALLMHGLYSASIAYIALGPEYSIAYNLADAGFDVWMGNARGSKNSRRHVTLNPDDPVDSAEFFDFSWEEIGMYDVAAMVDYILEKTGKQQLHYVGHSQGGTVFLALASMRPEYNEKFASAHLLAGVGYQDYFPNEELVSVAALTDIIYNTATLMGFREVYPPNSTVDETDPQYNAIDYCLGDIRMRHVCRVIGIRDILAGFDLEAFLQPNDAVGGGSLKQLAHYGQNIRDKLFRRFHYGSATNNQEVYGTPEPTLYDLSLITTNTVMHYTISDVLLDERDVLAMAAVMPNTVTRKVARDSFLHEDFAAATDAKVLVTKFMVEEMSKIENFEYNNIFEDTSEESENLPDENENQENDDQSNDQAADENEGENNESADGNDTNDANDANDANDTNDSSDDALNPPVDPNDANLTGSSQNVVLSSLLQFYLLGCAVHLLSK